MAELTVDFGPGVVLPIAELGRGMYLDFGLEGQRAENIVHRAERQVQSIIQPVNYSTGSERR
jgi:hypothetical protein